MYVICCNYFLSPEKLRINNFGQIDWKMCPSSLGKKYFIREEADHQPPLTVKRSSIYINREFLLQRTLKDRIPIRVPLQKKWNKKLSSTVISWIVSKLAVFSADFRKIKAFQRPFKITYTFKSYLNFCIGSQPPKNIFKRSSMKKRPS